MGKEPILYLPMREKDTAKAKIWMKNIEGTHNTSHDEQQIAPQSRHTSNVAQQWPFLNGEANAPFIINNGEVKIGSCAA